MIVLSAPLTLYANKATGIITNDGLTPATPLPEPRDCQDLLRSGYDLNGNTVTISVVAGTYTKGLSASGAQRGQRSPSDVTVSGAGFSTIIAPTGTVAGLEINYRGAIKLDQLTIDMTNSHQDAIISGKRGSIVLGAVRFAGGHQDRNHITMAEFCDLSVLGNLWIAGDAQCFLQMDQFSTGYYNTNGIPNQLAMFFEVIPAYGRQPYFSASFLDVKTSNLNIQNIDYHGWNGGIIPCAALGYRFRSRPYSIIDLNSLPPSTLPGSVDTAWAVQGTIM